MAKLYAEITSDKGGRVVSKSGDGYIRVVLQNKNKQTHAIIYRGDTPEIIEFDKF